MLEPPITAREPSGRTHFAFVAANLVGSAGIEDAAVCAMARNAPWIVLLAETHPDDHAPVPSPFRSDAEDSSDLETAHRWAERHFGAVRILPVVREQDRPWWSSLLSRVPRAHVVEEPLDRGTGPGLLAATLRIAGWDPDGWMAVLQADGRRPWVELMRRLEALLERARAGDDIHVSGRVAVGPVAAFRERFRRVQSDLYLAFHQRPNAVWSLIEVYPYVDYVDAWRDVLGSTEPAKQLTPA